MKVFETKELFLKKDSISAGLGNPYYLFITGNKYSQSKELTAYLNDLPINYALNRMIKGTKFRSYKLSAYHTNWDIKISCNYIWPLKKQILFFQSALKRLKSKQIQYRQ